MRGVKVAAISYINTTPFVYGLKHTDEKLYVDLSLSVPSECVDKISSGECDISIVSVEALPSLKDKVDIISDYCISATGAVRTVVLFSNTEMKDIRNIYLDYDSLTSVQLVKILASEYWHINPNYININYTSCGITPQDGDAYVMIGDKVFDWESKFTYTYDMSEAWHNLTGLPFVFAVWVARKDIDKEVIKEFNRILSVGVSHIEDVIRKDINIIDCKTAYSYLTKNLEFRLTYKKQCGLDLYNSKSFLLKSKEFSSHGY